MKIYVLVEATYDYYEFLQNLAVGLDKEKLIEQSKELSEYPYINMNNITDHYKKYLHDKETCHCYIEEWEV